jgi:hypothetical protein
VTYRALLFAPAALCAGRDIGGGINASEPEGHACGLCNRGRARIGQLRRMPQARTESEIQDIATDVVADATSGKLTELEGRLEEA